MFCRSQYQILETSTSKYLLTLYCKRYYRNLAINNIDRRSQDRRSD